MTRFFTGLAVAAMILATTMPVQAGGHPSSHHGSHHGQHSHYASKHGKKFSHGHYYSGRHHSHWSHSKWSTKHRTRYYWDASIGAWYYWCAARERYYPVSYIAIAPPTPEPMPSAAE